MSALDASRSLGRAEVWTADADADTGKPRRLFVRVLAGALGAGYAGLLGYPVYRYLASPIEKAAEAGAVTQVILPEAGNLPVNSALMFKFGNRAAILIHHADDTWTAFSAVCTHLGCTVQYQANRQRIYCACHGGVYDAKTGAAVAGPPPKGLPVYRVERQDGQIIIHRS